MRAQVGIVGAGPAGLMLAHLLHREGIESVVLEAHSREYVEKRVRAGVLEQNTVDLLRETGVGERVRREGLVHRGVELRFSGAGHRIDLSELTGGRAITIYGQQEVVKDLIRARLAAGGRIDFEVSDVSLHGLTTHTPRVRYAHEGRSVEIECGFIAGCDGFHGVCREAIPRGVLDVYERDYPFGWLGVLAAVPPSSAELIYAYHERGFALHSMRSRELTRLYLQCAPGERIQNWSDDRIWDELHLRLGAKDGFALREGPILERGTTAMRSFVVEPLQYGKLFLVGDAGHIVPPTGAKGLNLAVADVRVLAEALVEWYRHGRRDLLESYSATVLRRIWRVQDFSSWMTSMLHRFPDDPSGFQGRLQLAQLRYVTTSEAAATSLAENYVGMERV